MNPLNNPKKGQLSSSSMEKIDWGGGGGVRFDPWPNNRKDSLREKQGTSRSNQQVSKGGSLKKNIMTIKMNIRTRTLNINNTSLFDKNYCYSFGIHKNTAPRTLILTLKTELFKPHQLQESRSSTNVHPN